MDEQVLETSRSTPASASRRLSRCKEEFLPCVIGERVEVSLPRHPAVGAVCHFFLNVRTSRTIRLMALNPLFSPLTRLDS
ncbi:MAG: hypothetical protein XD66_1187 [Thermacetogenium phaeum]|uniref:Uncharacterized protein n=1 Tax=Thermacetogenium phaeum TaxID=85874 RepID=A0A117LB81_9THEO|nr:MAG: hypothetical protein XD66_1187 [Thermacetogenium phaeum]